MKIQLGAGEAGQPRSQGQQEPGKRLSDNMQEHSME